MLLCTEFRRKPGKNAEKLKSLLFGTSPLSSGTNGYKSYTIWYKAVSDGIVDLSDILFHFKCFLIFNVVTNNPSQI